MKCNKHWKITAEQKLQLLIAAFSMTHKVQELKNLQIKYLKKCNISPAVDVLTQGGTFIAFFS